jgi:thioesterase domain-containing protein/NAD(P)-dependent dehydrogenase (short-subunit alcohol dehydrogenase family)/acyl carrier protein
MAKTGKEISPEGTQPNIHRDVPGWFLYRRQWKKKEPSLPLSLGPLCWLLFLDHGGVGEQIDIQLTGAEHRVIRVRQGERYLRLGNDSYQIRPDSRSDYISLIADIARRGTPPQKIMHLWTLLGGVSPQSVEDVMGCSFYSLLYLAQALGEHKIRAVDITVISDSLYCVNGEATWAPERATLLGPVRVIPKEYPGIICRSIDCDPSAFGTSLTAIQLIAEHSSAFRESVVVYRGADRWVESIERVNSRFDEHVTQLRADRTILITGGLGRRGLAIAEQLFKRCRSRIVLVDRKSFPPEEQWRSKLEDPNISEDMKDSLAGLLRIISAGAKVKVISADVTKKDEMRKAWESGSAEFNGIHGIIHAANFRDDGNIQTKTVASAAKVLAPQVAGVRVLEEIAGDTTLDFFTPFSSLNCLQPEPKTVDFTAACAFLDCLASNQRKFPLFAINWPEEKEKQSGLNSNGDHVSEDWTRQMAEAFVDIPWQPGDRLFALSPTELDHKYALDNEENAGLKKTSTGLTGVEAEISRWLKEIMGLEDCSLDADLFDLGLDSLVGAQLFARINSTYGINLGLAELFEARTIRLLSNLVRQEQAPEQPGQPKPWSPLVPIQPNGKLPPLFLISGLGGNVVKFHSLVFHLGDGQPVYGLLPRGIDGRAAFHTRIEEMAADYVKAIREMQPEGEYRLAGYCFGGVVAFEAARQIEQEGAKVAFLGLFDSPEWNYSLSVEDSMALMDRISVFIKNVEDVVMNKNRWTHIKRIIAPKLLHLNYLAHKMTGRPLPQESGSLEVINSLALTNYQPRSISSKLSLFRAENSGVREGNDRTQGWGKYALGGVEVHSIPSTHFDMFHEPTVKILAEQLEGCLKPGMSTVT